MDRTTGTVRVAKLDASHPTRTTGAIMTTSDVPATPVPTASVPTASVPTAPDPAASVRAASVRVSDAEREEVARRLRAAAADGRLTLSEADERQASAYAARFHHDLAPLTADLPAPEPEVAAPGWRGLSPSARRRLTVHVAVGAVVAVLLLLRWAVGPVLDGPGFVGDGPRLWPVWPLFWITLSLVFHYRRAVRRAG